MTPAAQPAIASSCCEKPDRLSESVGENVEVRMKKNSYPAQHKFELPEVLDLKAATPLAGALLALRGSDIAIDASHVERVGGQCLQILLSAMTTWHADEATLDFVNPSPAFIEGFNLLGVDPARFMDQGLSQ
jgi:chemotaxis protein CheX